MVAEDNHLYFAYKSPLGMGKTQKRKNAIKGKTHERGKHTQKEHLKREGNTKRVTPKTKNKHQNKRGNTKDGLTEGHYEKREKHPKKW